MAGVDPRSLLPHCCDCKTPVRPTEVGVSHEVIGFVEYRGATGGANAVVDRRSTGRYRCRSCSQAKRHGISPDQPTLI